MKKCKVLRDYNNDCGEKRKAGTTIKLRDTAAKMRKHGGFVEILNPDKKPALLVPQAGPAILHRGEAVVPAKNPKKKNGVKMKRCKVLRKFFDSKLHKAGAIEEFIDAEANRHALAGRVKIMKPKKKKAKVPAKKKTAPKKPAISSSKKSAGVLAKPKPKKKPTAKKKGKKKNA